MEHWRLAVDFGTSFTTVATQVDDRIIPVEISNSRYLPSTVAFDDSGALLTGAEALQRAASHPECTVRLPKRALVAGRRVRLARRTFETGDLVAAVLERAAAEARAYHCAEPDEVILTHPAAWEDEQLEALTKATLKAGLGAPRLVPEPVAAAAHYVLGCTAAECARSSRLDLPTNAHLAVYDLGGGTFDTAVVGRADTQFTLVGKAGGDGALGGEDFDERLLDLVADRAARLDGNAWDVLAQEGDPITRRSLSRLRRDITDAKHSLSRVLKVDLAVHGFASAFRISRDDLHEVIKTDLERTLDLLTATIDDAGLDISDVAAIALAGGSCRIPWVSDLVAGRFGELPLTAPDPKSAVAHGALLLPEQSAAPPARSSRRLHIDPDDPHWLP